MTRKNVVHWGRRNAGLFVLCPVGMVEIWSGLQLSRGVWPHRLAPGIVATAQSHAGDTERQVEMNVGVGLDVCVDGDVNEPLHNWEGGKTGKERKEDIVNSEKGERGPPGSQEKVSHSESTRGLETGGKKTLENIYPKRQLANLVMWLLHSTQQNTITHTVKHIHYFPMEAAENDWKGQSTLWKRRSSPVNINKREDRLLSFSVNPSCFLLPYSFRKDSGLGSSVQSMRSQFNWTFKKKVYTVYTVVCITRTVFLQTWRLRRVNVGIMCGTNTL